MLAPALFVAFLGCAEQVAGTGERLQKHEVGHCHCFKYLLCSALIPIQRIVGAKRRNTRLVLGALLSVTMDEPSSRWLGRGLQ
jgi:hypothetical protein